MVVLRDLGRLLIDHLWLPVQYHLHFTVVLFPERHYLLLGTQLLHQCLLVAFFLEPTHHHL